MSKKPDILGVTVVGAKLGLVVEYADTLKDLTRELNDAAENLLAHAEGAADGVKYAVYELTERTHTNRAGYHGYDAKQFMREVRALRGTTKSTKAQMRKLVKKLQKLLDAEVELP